MSEFEYVENIKGELRKRQLFELAASGIYEAIIDFDWDGVQVDDIVYVADSMGSLLDLGYAHPKYVSDVSEGKVWFFIDGCTSLTATYGTNRKGTRPIIIPSRVYKEIVLPILQAYKELMSSGAPIPTRMTLGLE